MCNQSLSDDAYYETLGESPARLPAYVVRRPKVDGGTCVARAGPEQYEGQAVAQQDILG